MATFVLYVIGRRAWGWRPGGSRAYLPKQQLADGLCSSLKMYKDIFATSLEQTNLCIIQVTHMNYLVSELLPIYHTMSPFI